MSVIARVSGVVSEVSQAGVLSRLTEMATIAGITVVGGFIPSILGIGTALTFTQAVELEGKVQTSIVAVQDVLDQILPFAVPIALVGLIYWLLTSRKWKPLQALLLLVVIAFVGSLVGFF